MKTKLRCIIFTNIIALILMALVGCSGGSGGSDGDTNAAPHHNSDD